MKNMRAAPPLGNVHPVVLPPFVELYAVAVAPLACRLVIVQYVTSIAPELALMVAAVDVLEKRLMWLPSVPTMSSDATLTVVDVRNSTFEPA